MIGWIVLGVSAVIVIWLIAIFNSLVSLKNQTLNGWKQIDVQLKKIGRASCRERV